MADEKEPTAEGPTAAEAARGYLTLMSTPQIPDVTNALGLAANAWATLALVEAVEKQTKTMEWAAEYLVSTIQRGQG